MNRHFLQNAACNNSTIFICLQPNKCFCRNLHYKILDFYSGNPYNMQAEQTCRSRVVGRARTIGNRVNVKSVSRVRIPPSAPYYFSLNSDEFGDFLLPFFGFSRYISRYQHKKQALFPLQMSIINPAPIGCSLPTLWRNKGGARDVCSAS